MNAQKAVEPGSVDALLTGYRGPINQLCRDV